MFRTSKIGNNSNIYFGNDYNEPFHYKKTNPKGLALWASFVELKGKPSKVIYNTLVMYLDGTYNKSFSGTRTIMIL